MKLLFLCELYEPSKGGVQEVVKQIAENLAKLGHDVSVATSYLHSRKYEILNNVTIHQFKISGKLAIGYQGTQQEIERYSNFLRNSRYDFIICFAAQQWTVDLFLEIIDEVSCGKVFVPTGFSGLYDPKYQHYFHNMKNWLHKFDMNVFLSDNYRDINFARTNNVKNICIIPNGASAQEFDEKQDNNFRLKFGIPESDFLILHVGSFTGVKGQLETISIFEKADIWNSSLVLVGSSAVTALFGVKATLHKIFLRVALFIKLYKFRFLSRHYSDISFYKQIANKLNRNKEFLEKNKKIFVLELPRNITVDAFKTADLFLFPSNIECSPIVLFEACASKTPFLTTDVGNSKEIIEWTNGGYLLPTLIDRDGYSHAIIQESADMLTSLFNNRESLKYKGEKGYESWKNDFTWEKIANRFERLFVDLKHGKRIQDA